MERIYQKIGRLKEYLNIIKSIKGDCLKKFSYDMIYRGALLHYLYLISDTSISLAEMVIKYKELRFPQSYAEAIDILGENNILEPEFASDFSRIAGFRNFLAHDYEQIDPDSICRGILDGLNDVEKFIQQIEESLGIKQKND